MLEKHECVGLSLGCVKENVAIVPNEQRKLWEDRGFKAIDDHPMFYYVSSSFHSIMLGVPLNIKEFGVENFINSQIVDVNTRCGSYGMGGPGFFGLKLQGSYGVRWLTYCIWGAGEHVLFDDRVIECYSKYEQQYRPVIMSDDDVKCLNSFREKLLGMTVTELLVSQDDFELRLMDADGEIHRIESHKFSEKFPEQGGTGRKRNSYDTGEMKDYWLVTYDGTQLIV